MTHGPDSLLDEVRTQLEQLGVDASGSESVQDWIDRYTFLTNDFCYFDPSTDHKTTGPELVRLEAQLNQYWLGLLPSEKAPSCPPIENELIAQHRFVSQDPLGMSAG